MKGSVSPLSMFLVILRQFLASSEATTNWNFIVSRWTELDGSYIVYLPIPYVINVLYPQGNQNRRTYTCVWCQYTKVPLGYGYQFQTRVCSKLQLKLLLHQQLVNLVIVGELVNNYYYSNIYFVMGWFSTNLFW